MASLAAMPQIRAADVALSIFENVGLGFGRLQGLSIARHYSLPHVMLTCWLAEDCQRMSSAQLRSVRRSIRSVSTVAVFSANQVPILHEVLAVERERINVVPFGVDTQYYDPSAVNGLVGGGGLVAVGGDSRRDYATLAEAIRIADVPMTLVCYPRNIAGLDLPPQIEVRSGVYHDDYRKLLLSADLVVTPTTAPAYPSGQSVVLEAMSMGRATLTTASPAMQEYVTDGVNGVLVPPRDPVAMAQLITGMLADDDRRKSLGTAAALTIRKCFGLEHMWDSVSKLMCTASGR
jgi:glycosyltransferase involved in cell wall biosynthesis